MCSPRVHFLYKMGLEKGDEGRAAPVASSQTLHSDILMGKGDKGDMGCCGGVKGIGVTSWQGDICPCWRQLMSGVHTMCVALYLIVTRLQACRADAIQRTHHMRTYII